MANKIYKKGMFQYGYDVLMANEVKVGMIIALSNNKYFYVDDIAKFFINDEVSKLYGDDEEPKPEHTKITFYDENENSISEVKGTELCICFNRADGKHNPSGNLVD